jgi:hypothetical protein
VLLKLNQRYTMIRTSDTTTARTSFCRQFIHSICPKNEHSTTNRHRRQHWLVRAVHDLHFGTIINVRINTVYLTLHNTGKCCDFVQFRELIVVARSTNCILQRTDKIAVFSGIIDAVCDEFDHRSDCEKKAHLVA